MAAALLADLAEADGRFGAPAGGSLMTAKDLKGYVAKVRSPIEVCSGGTR